MVLQVAAAPPQGLVTGVIHESTSPRGEAANVSAIGFEKEGDVYLLHGSAEIDYRGYRLYADEMKYDSSTGEAEASGHVRLEGGPHDEHIQASNATYNVNDETGVLHDAVATLGMALRSGRMVLTSPSPLAFTGKVVRRTGPDQFIVEGGMVTTCSLESPAWSFNAERVVVDLGSKAALYHSTFRLHGVPVFYLPWVARPVEKVGRQSGFLLPTIGASSRKGTTVGESFYWAINRSMDALIGAEYFSERGWAQHGEFRARPDASSNVDIRYYGVLDRGTHVGGVLVDQGGEEVRGTAESVLPHVGRVVADLDYLSSFLFRLAFAENFAQAVNSEVKSTAFASRDFAGMFLNGMAARYQNFESTTRGDLVTILHVPSVESATTDRQLGNTRLFWSYEAAAQGVSRREPGFVTANLVGRFDLTPSLALPVTLHGWSLRPELALRETHYTQRLQPNGGLGVPLSDPIDRRAIETDVEIRPPATARVFERPVLGRKLKHTIEPRVVYRLLNGVDNFQNIIRFDSRDLLSDTNEVEYAITSRVFAKRLKDGGNCNVQNPSQPAQTVADQEIEEGSTFNPQASATEELNPCERAGSVRQILSWEVAQKAFFNRDFGGAVVDGKRNVLTTTADFTGIAFLTEPRSFSPIISRLRIQTSAHTDAQWNLDYDAKKGRISGSMMLVDWRLGEFFLGGSHTFFRAPGEIFVTNPIPGPDQFNQFRVLLGYGHPNKRGLSAAATFGFDANAGFLQYGTIQTSYNWSCIGVSAEYRRFALAVRNENQFRFSLSLANIGTFGTLRRQERLF